jgi:hypothetical protein
MANMANLLTIMLTPNWASRRALHPAQHIAANKANPLTHKSTQHIAANMANKLTHMLTQLNSANNEMANTLRQQLGLKRNNPTTPWNWALHNTQQRGSDHHHLRHNTTQWNSEPQINATQQQERNRRSNTSHDWTSNHAPYRSLNWTNYKRLDQKHCPTQTDLNTTRIHSGKNPPRKRKIRRD